MSWVKILIDPCSGSPYDSETEVIIRSGSTRIGLGFNEENRSLL